MDNETLVDQIVRSLSFEVVAAPQNVSPVDTSSKSTPLNVKIKVRKKQGAGLRHGVISMPQVDAKTDNRKHEPRERIRLVSSDQTIMNFDVLMEAEFDKGALRNQKKQELNMITTENDKEVNLSQIYVKKNKDIFGKCKPGGCLDPPFGEDKYSYQPKKQTLSQPLQEDSTKLRSSSIFKNNIFKKKRKSSQDDEQLDKTDSARKIDSLIDLHETGSLTQHSNPLITYPHPLDLDSNKVQKQEEKKSSKDDDKSSRIRNSSEDRSRTSSEGSYFVIPKRTKRLSSQNDSLGKTEPNQIGGNITQLKSEVPVDDNVPKIEPTSQKGTSFIPIPIVVPLNNSETATTDPELLAQNKTNLTSPIDGVDEQDKQYKPLSADTEADSKSETNKNNLNSIEKDSLNIIEPISNANTDDQFDAKSHPLLAEAREKAVIGITDSYHKTGSINTLQLPEQSNVPYSSVNLKELWENKNKPLISAADVIFKDTVPITHKSSVTSRISNRSHVRKSISDNFLPKDSDSITKNYNLSQNNSTIKNKPSELVSSPDSKKLSQISFDNGNTEGLNNNQKLSESKGNLSNEKEDSKKLAQIPFDNCNTEELNNNQQFSESKGNLSNEKEDSKKLTQIPFDNGNTEELNNNQEFSESKGNLSNKKDDSKKLAQIPFDNDNTEELNNNQQLSEKYSSPPTILDKIELYTKSDAEEETNKKSSMEPYEASYVDDDDIVTVENIPDFKKVRSVSELSITGSLEDPDQEFYVPKHAEEEALQISGKQANVEYNSHLVNKPGQTPTEYFEMLSENVDKNIQPTSILRKPYWKVDIALQSYIDENNERIIKSFDSKQAPQQQPNHSVLVAQCYLRSDTNEIKVPVDHDNDLNVKITPNQPVENLSQETADAPDDTTKKKNIKIDVPVSGSESSHNYTTVRNNSKLKEGKYSKETTNDDIRNALSRIYDEELVPLQDIIKGLRDEIDALTSYQTKFKAMVSKTTPTPKRPKPVRLLQPNKRCACIRNTYK